MIQFYLNNAINRRPLTLCHVIHTNGDHFVTIDSVTSLHFVYTQCNLLNIQHITHRFSTLCDTRYGRTSLIPTYNATVGIVSYEYSTATCILSVSAANQMMPGLWVSCNRTIGIWGTGTFRSHALSFPGTKRPHSGRFVLGNETAYSNICSHKLSSPTTITRSVRA